MNAPGTLPNLRHLRMVQMIGQHGSISRASRDMNISQPAVTLAVSRLEDDLGAALFDRRTTGSYATEIGARFLLRVDRFFAILEAGIAAAWGGGGPRRAARPLAPVDRLMTTTHLRALSVVSEPETLAETADALGIAPESLFRAAREFERIIGRPLFSQTAGGTAINRTGEELARQFRLAAREIEFGRSEIRLAQGTGEPRIVIGALPMAGSHELSRCIARFLELRPQAQVCILPGQYRRLLYELQNGRIDLIFGILWRPDWVSDIVEEALFEDDYCVVTRIGHPLSQIAQPTPADLARYVWVVPAVGTPRRTHIDHLFHDTVPKPHYGVETSSLATLRALLQDSDLISVIARSEVQTDADLGALSALRCPDLDRTLIKGISTRRDWLPTAAHRELLDCFRTTTRAAAPP